MTLLPTRLVNEHQANEATDTVTKALEGMKERAASLVSKPVYQPRPEPEPDIPQAPVQPVMRAPAVAEPEPVPHITLPSVQEIISGGTNEELAGSQPAVARDNGSASIYGRTSPADVSPSADVSDVSPIEAPSVAPSLEPSASLTPITLPSTEEITGIKIEPEPAPSPLTTLGGTPEAEALTQPGGTAYTSPETPTAAPQAASAPPLDMSSPDTYKRTLMANAQGIAQKYDLPASIIAAIPIQEAGFKGSELTRRANNLFSIKGAGPAGSEHFGSVWEVIGGKDVQVPADFRKYNSAAESFEDFAKLITETPRYAPAVEAWKKTRDPNAFIQAVQRAGYATDPTWAGKVAGIAAGMPSIADSAVQAGVAPSAQTAMPAAGQSTSASFDAQSIAKQWEGKKYVFGGAGGRGAGLADTDCSGFVAQITGLPAHTDAAYNALKQRGAGAIEEKEAAPGDIVFYMGGGTGGAITHHMGIYAGPGKVLDMSTSGGGGVNIRPLTHAGKFEILRDPANPKTPDVPPTAAPPPEIVPTPVESGGEKPTQSQIDQWSQMATSMGEAADRIKGVPVAQALQSGNTMAMEDLSAGSQSGLRHSDEDYPVQGSVDSQGAGQTGTDVRGYQPPPRDIRGDYGLAPVEPGDYQLASPTALTPAEPAAVEPTPPVAPATGGNIPWHEQVAQSVSSAVSSALQNVFGGQKPDLSVGAADIQNRAGAVSAPGEPSIADVVQANVSNPSPTQRVFGQVADAATGFQSGSIESVDRQTELQSRALGIKPGGPLSSDEEMELAGLVRQNVADVAGVSTTGKVAGVVGPTKEALEEAVKRGVPGAQQALTEFLADPSRVPNLLRRVTGQGVSDAPSAGIVSRAQADEAAQAATDRYYHGTGSDFERLGASNWPSGKGAWMTSDPKTANDYAKARRGTDGVGPNIRPIDVPSDVRLLDLRSAEARELEAAYYATELDARPGPLVQDAFRERGYDGIRAGKDIMIFPESLDKIRNATAGTPGGFVPGSSNIGAGIARGAAQGGVAGGYAASQEEGATPQSVATGALAGAATRAVSSGIGAARGPRGAGMVARAVQQGAESGPPERPPLPSGRPITLSTEDEVARLRLDLFPEEAREPIKQAARAVDWARDQRRGVMPDAQVAALAEDMARRGDAWLGAGRAGRAYNPEETVALRNLVAGQAAKVSELTEGIATARMAGTTPDLLIAQRAAEAGKLAGYVKLAEGARAEAGRTLRQYATEARLIDADPQQAVERIYKRLGGRDNAIKAVDEFTKLTQDGADPFQMAKFWSKVENPPPGFDDWFRALRYNSMLSGPRTFEVNTVGGLVEVPWRLARDTMASTLRGRPEEIAPELTGLWVGAQKGVNAFMETLHHGITAEQAARGDLPRNLADRLENPVARGVASTLEAPGRVMQATDEFFRQTAYGMAKYRMAAVSASKEGLRGQEWAQRVAQLIDDAPASMDKQATEIADRMLFHNEMGDLGNAIGQVGKVPVIGNILVPFVRTVYNITARGIDRSPLGIVGTGIDVARGAYKDGAVPKGAAPLGERLGDNAIGGLMGMAFIGQAMQGNVTGAGPDDPEKKNQLRAQGWQPYSLKVGDKYVSYSNWGPMSVPLAMAASVAEGQTYKKADATTADVVTDTFRRFGELATEQTYLQGMGVAFKAIKEPDVYGSQSLTQFIQTLVPFGSAINTAGQASDEFVRRPDRGDMGQALAARFPGARESVPVAQDVLGQPVRNMQQGAGAVQPLKITEQQPNAVIQAFQDAQIDIGKPPKALSDVELTPSEQRRYQQLMGEVLSQRARRTVEGGAWVNRTPVSKAAYLQAAYDSARETAEARLTRELGSDFARRRRESVLKKAG